MVFVCRSLGFGFYEAVAEPRGDCLEEGHYPRLLVWGVPDDLASSRAIFLGQPSSFRIRRKSMNRYNTVSTSRISFFVPSLPESNEKIRGSIQCWTHTLPDPISRPDRSGYFLNAQWLYGHAPQVLLRNSGGETTL